MGSSLVSAIADNTQKTSLAHRMRFGRHQFFLSCLDQIRQDRAAADLPPLDPIQILDIGGTSAYWQAMGFEAPDVEISLLNLVPNGAALPPGMKACVGDACNLSAFADQSIDLVFSNSVIEHLFTLDKQAEMAREVMRVGKKYFIQTPNYGFPIEPHWVFPFFHYLPPSWRVWLTQTRAWGHIPQEKNKAKALMLVNEVRLMTRQELENCFPGARLYAERLGGLTKSWIAHNF